ncbi:hypothetical protein BHM03_00034421, partial [Ensete ventricosum]
MSLRRRGGAMVMEMLTTRRGSGFWRATGSDEEEEVGARQAAGSDEGWLRLRWLQREEDEEGMVGGDYGSKEAEAALLCADGEEEGVGDNSNAEEATGKNGRHDRGGDDLRGEGQQRSVGGGCRWGGAGQWQEQGRKVRGEGAWVEQRWWWKCRRRKRWPAGEVAEGEGSGDGCAWQAAGRWGRRGKVRGAPSSSSL